MGNTKSLGFGGNMLLKKIFEEAIANCIPEITRSVKGKTQHNAQTNIHWNL
jgi:hypothetical protein